MKRREMKRNGVAEIFDHPFAEFFGFVGVVIFFGYHQIGDLKPDVGFLFEPLERVQHGREMRERQLVIKTLGKCFKIDVSGVDVAINFRSRFGSDVAGGDHHTFNSSLARQTRYVDDELAPNHRIVIREGDARNFMFDRQLDDLLGTRVQALCFIELGLADAPVLAESATKIAAGGAEAQDFAARQKVIERLFFDGIDGKSGRGSIAERKEFTADVLTNVAKARLAIPNSAKAGAKRAKYLAVSFGMPPKGFSHEQNIALLLTRRKGGYFAWSPAFFRQYDIQRA